MKTTLCLYGNIALLRGFCPSCGHEAIILDGKYTCCDAVVLSEPERVKRIIEPVSMRKIPPREKQKEILAEQDNCCFYCGKKFGSFVWKIRGRKSRLVKIVLNWDHLIPFKYNQNNFAYNFVASCRICNSIKSDHIFKNINEMKMVLAYRRRKKGYVEDDDPRIVPPDK